MSYLRYLCLFTYSGVQHILCCGFFFCISSSSRILSDIMVYLLMLRNHRSSFCMSSLMAETTEVEIITKGV
jgi:hypothetical protein